MEQPQRITRLRHVYAQADPSGWRWSTFIAAGDFNGDGKADLVVSHPLGGCCSFQANGEVTIILGNGDGTFRPPVDYLVGQVPENDKPQGVAVADFNGDGNADLAVADGSGSQEPAARLPVAPTPIKYCATLRTSTRFCELERS